MAKAEFELSYEDIRTLLTECTEIEEIATWARHFERQAQILWNIYNTLNGAVDE